ncbi:MAG: enoyl-CoA hydratase/isomerase family protein [Nitratireductor sp.]|nr:enoyl-CoA hydratase/isomerase family protein [Nitratireductor sp.]
MSEKPELRGARLETEGRIARLVLDRDDVRNELTGTKLYEAIVETVDWINSGEEISVLVITGTGKSFSAGGNVKDMHERRGAFDGDVYELQAKYRTGIQMMATAMHRLDVPSIAQINGAAIGAGLDLACMCDLRIASETARLGETFVNLGIIPGDGGAWFLQRLIGYQKAAELTFTGRLIDAREAMQLGILLDVVPAEKLAGRVNALAKEIAAKPPRALRLTKRLMKNAQRLELDDFLDVCAVFQGMSHHTADHGEAVDAFLSKRNPRFSGR